MIIKKLFLTLVMSFFLTINAFSAGSSSDDSSSGKIKTDYDKAVTHIKLAKKYEKKNQSDKANKRYEKALKLLLKSNMEKPNNADTLNFLGFTTRKLGDFANGERYYLQGLSINPNHRGINEYLGELYVATNRIELAKERLEVLKDCNCEEFNELKDVIEGNKTSKY